MFVYGNQGSIKRGQRFYSKYPHSWLFKPKFTCAKVTAENVNEIIEKSGYKGTIGLLSIDIDGNDYWVWQAIEVVQPQVVIIETCVEFGVNNIVVPYNPDYEYPGKHPIYHGASPVAMVCLAKRKGYRLLTAKDLGINFIFVKNGIADDLLHEVSAESLLNHPAVQDSYQQFQPIKDWEYLKG